MSKIAKMYVIATKLKVRVMNQFHDAVNESMLFHFSNYSAE